VTRAPVRREVKPLISMQRFCSGSGRVLGARRRSFLKRPDLSAARWPGSKNENCALSFPSDDPGSNSVHALCHRMRTTRKPPAAQRLTSSFNGRARTSARGRRRIECRNFTIDEHQQRQENVGIVLSPSIVLVFCCFTSVRQLIFTYCN
jgi:hypothetical protein